MFLNPRVNETWDGCWQGRYHGWGGQRAVFHKNRLEKVSLAGLVFLYRSGKGKAGVFILSQQAGFRGQHQPGTDPE